MKIAAYQAPLDATHSIENALRSIREQIDLCESTGVEILCCPEGVLGGLADYVARPWDIALDVKSGQLEAVLAPLASEKVTTIVGFTEADHGRLYNSAAIFYKGSVAGIYRKLHPAINRSVYDAGDRTPVFTIAGLTFGIVICRDSAYPELAEMMVSQGATALFIPTNNGLPPDKGGAELAGEARDSDIACAAAYGIYVIRADVAGRMGNLISYGSSGIVAPDGAVLQATRQLVPEIILADIEVSPQGQAHL